MSLWPELAGRRVLVLGAARTGVAVARALRRAGADVRLSEAAERIPDVVRAELAGLVTELEVGSHERALGWLDDADLVVPSPGIPPHSAVLTGAVARGLEVISEIELAWRAAQAPLVAITGTNGKTTTCRIAGRLLEAAEVRTIVCGNIGEPFVEAVDTRPPPDAYVVEVSSFQLAFCRTLRPRVAVVLNLAPDHLDWHGSFEAYKEAKGRIALRQTAQDWFVHPFDDEIVAGLARAPGPRRLGFGITPADGDGAYVSGGRIVVRIGQDEIVVGESEGPARRGRPFVEDALAASAATVAIMTMGLGSVSAFVGHAGRALSDFMPDAHRLDPVAEADGVRYVDDSKATNPHAAVAGLRAFESVVLIAGGRNKGLDLGVLRAEAARVKAVVGIGEAGPDVLNAFAGVPGRLARDMREAVRAARELARPADVVLLSPACASFDAYESYAQRGDDFRACVLDLLAGVGEPA